MYLHFRPRGYTSARGIKFQRAYTKFRTRCAHGIWTLILLMYLRVMYTSLVVFDCIDLPINGLVSTYVLLPATNCIVSTCVELVYWWQCQVLQRPRTHTAFHCWDACFFVHDLSNVFCWTVAIQWSSRGELLQNWQVINMLCCWIAICYTEVFHYISRIWVQSEVQMVGNCGVGKKILFSFLLVCDPLY